ncbi:MAG TPA: hypothetical protein VJ904_06700, partial [Tichowtungia sp.]|nr:hypothetical protein [Tichowtungia sp.]
ESMGDFKNIRFSDSLIKNTKGGAMKILSMDGCRLENLLVHDITIENTDMTLFMRLGERLNKYREDKARTPGHMKNVTIRNITSSTSAEGRLKAPTGIIITGEKTADDVHRIEDVTIENMQITLEGKGDLNDVVPVLERTLKNNYPEYIFFSEDRETRLFPAYGVYARHVKGLTLKNVEITTRHPDSRPFAVLDDAHDVTMTVKTNPGNGELLQKTKSTGIELSITR